MVIVSGIGWGWDYVTLLGGFHGGIPGICLTIEGSKFDLRSVGKIANGPCHGEGFQSVLIELSVTSVSQALTIATYVVEQKNE